MGSRRLNLAANPSQQAEKALSLFHNNKVSFNLYKGLAPPLTKRRFYPGQATKAGDLGGRKKEKGKKRGRGIGRLIRLMP